MFAPFKPSMALRKFVYLILFSGLWMIVLSGETGCANIVPPTGGPRDSLPPVLVSVTPKDSSLRFTEKRIVFNFDEYVDVQSINENLIVSPTPKINPVVEFKLRTVTVRIKDTLEPNTTYTLNFGDAIRDINEGNILKNFTYVFSTGTFLDNRELSGNVLLAETGKVDSTLIVMLHQHGDDSAVAKERPRYYTKLDGKGHFHFRYLPAGQFYLYALKDESSTRRYESRAQLFAFADKPVMITDSTPAQTLYAYAEPEEDVRKKRPTPAISKTERADKRLSFSTNLEGSRQDLLDSFKLSFPAPLKVFDSTAIRLTDITFQPVGNIHFIRDSSNTKFAFSMPWKPDSTYHLILSKNFAEDSAGKKLLKDDTITFKAMKEEDYGNVRLRFPQLDLTKHPVLQFVQGEKLVFSHVFTTNEFRQRLFRPGDYTLRILYDDNQNGRWDPGSFFGVHRQPEIVQAIAQKVRPIKANWENDEVVRW